MNRLTCTTVRFPSLRLGLLLLAVVATGLAPPAAFVNHNHQSLKKRSSPQGRIISPFSVKHSRLSESFASAFSLYTTSRRRTARRPPCFAALQDADSGTDDDEADEDNDDDDRLGMRGRFKDWMYGGTGSGAAKSYVQPIRLDGSSGGSIDDQKQQNPPRVKANFDDLFAGMPGMSDILGGEGSSSGDDASDPSEGSKTASSPSKADDAWFDEEKRQIMVNYDNVLKNMLDNLEKERQDDPEQVPENAEAVIKSVLKQEMDTEIAETRQKRVNEQISAYEKETRIKTDSKDVTSIQPNESVQKLIDESEAEFAQKEASRLRMQEFLQYEKQAALRSEEDERVQMPGNEEDLDEWALDRLKDMVQGRQDTDGDEMILDTLQENVEELERGMRKEADRRGSIQPDTMKEWQMYRSIATRLEASGKSANATSAVSDDPERENKIRAQLESWKDYVQKEDTLRKDSGLARGPKLPFAWQESDLAERQMMSSAENQASNGEKSQVEVRKELNRRSIEALESLLVTTDAARRERLQEEIEFLKTTLEGKDYLDVDEEMLQERVESGPIDTKGLFRTSSTDDDESSAKSSLDTDSTAVMTDYEGDDSFSDSFERPVQPPRTAFFEEDSEKDRTVPPPNTPFFTNDDDDEDDDRGGTLSSDSKLGTMEDQKLEAMFRRANARTVAERDAIRAQYTDFKEFEKGLREQSGLSGEAAQGYDGTTTADLKYNVSEVMKTDGDFDADAILQTIGPRPERRRKDEKSTGKEDQNEPTDPLLDSSVDEDKVTDSLYRAVSAVGGGRYKDDPGAKARQQTSFEDYLDKENELRRSLDNPDSEFVAASDEDLPSPTDDVEYAQEVLASLGSRPKPKRARIIDEGDFSDKGGALASKDRDEDEDDDKASEESLEASNEKEDIGLIPEWLRKENEETSSGKTGRKSFLGNDIDEVFDDTDYEHNMRQLHEYEKRRAGQGDRQMGIDISDVLGRRAYNTDDYADFKYDDDYFRGRRDGWGAESFEKRKKNLLEYIELDVLELNALMDHKDSVYSTGVSQYLPRINKPFSEFGAIFRLEGILLNVDGLQMKAWTKVADEYGFKSPTLDDIRQAAVTRPSDAAKNIFFWTDDFLECKHIAASHKRAFKEIFDAWAEDEGIAIPQAPASPETSKGSFAIDEDAEQSVERSIIQAPSSEVERIELMTKAWTATAAAYAKEAPQREAIFVAATLSPDIAVRQAFGWASDPLEIDDIVRTYRKNLKPGSVSSPDAAQTPSGRSVEMQVQVQRDRKNAQPLSQTDVMEMHYLAWAKVADTHGYEKPTSEEVLAAFVINEPEVAASGFGWSDDKDILAEVSRDFQNQLAELKGDTAEKIEPDKSGDANTAAPTEEKRPNSEDLFKASFKAWSAVAEERGLSKPDDEQVLFAMSVGPEEAVVNGFQWAWARDEVAQIVTSYKKQLEKSRAIWQAGGTNLPAQPKPQTSKPPKATGPSADEVYQATFEAWTETARKQGFSAPDDEQVQFAMTVGPEEAIVYGFQWTNDNGKVGEIKETYRQEVAKQRSKWQIATSEAGSSQTPQKEDQLTMFHINPGAADWVKSLLAVEMQCGVVSYLEREQVDALLQHAGLQDLIPADKRVSATNGYVTDKDACLGAALRLERRPDHCVVFDSTPQASVAAHDVEMQSVSLIGAYPRYELLSSDTTAASFDGLTAMNIRRLFSERVYDQPLADSQQNQPEIRRKTKTRYFFDDD